MFDPERRTIAFYLDVILGLHRALQNVEEFRKSSNAFMSFLVFAVGFPNSNLSVLMSGENLVAGDYDSLHQTTVGFECGEQLHVLPNMDILAVGSGVKEAAGGGKGVNVAFLPDQRADEGIFGT